MPGGFQANHFIRRNQIAPSQVRPASANHSGYFFITGIYQPDPPVTRIKNIHGHVLVIALVFLTACIFRCMTGRNALN